MYLQSSHARLFHKTGCTCTSFLPVSRRASKICPRNPCHRVNYPITKIHNLSKEIKAAMKDKSIEDEAPRLYHDSKFVKRSLSEFLKEAPSSPQTAVDKSDGLMSSVDQLDKHCEALSRTKTQSCFRDAFHSLGQVSECLSTVASDRQPERDTYTVSTCQTLVNDIKNTLKVYLTLSGEEELAEYQKLWVKSALVKDSVFALEPTLA